MSRHVHDERARERIGMRTYLTMRKYSSPEFGSILSMVASVLVLRVDVGVVVLVKPSPWHSVLGPKGKKAKLLSLRPLITLKDRHCCYFFSFFFFEQHLAWQVHPSTINQPTNQQHSNKTQPCHLFATPSTGATTRSARNPWPAKNSASSKRKKTMLPVHATITLNRTVSRPCARRPPSATRTSSTSK